MIDFFGDEMPRKLREQLKIRHFTEDFDPDVIYYHEDRELVFMWNGNPASTVRLYRYLYGTNDLVEFSCFTMEYKTDTSRTRDERYTVEEVLTHIKWLLKDEEWLSGTADEWREYAYAFYNPKRGRRRASTK